VFSPGNAKTNVRQGGKLHSQLMASSIENIFTKNYQNLMSGFQITVENVGNVFLRHSVVRSAIIATAGVFVI